MNERKHEQQAIMNEQKDLKDLFDRLTKKLQEEPEVTSEADIDYKEYMQAQFSSEGMRGWARAYVCRMMMRRVTNP